MLPRGTDPKIPLVYGGHTLDPGRRPARALPAPVESVVALARMSDGWLVASRPGSGATLPRGLVLLTRMSTSLAVLDARAGAPRFAGRGTTAVAYMRAPQDRDHPRSLVLVSADGTATTWGTGAHRVALPLGVTGSGQIVFNLITPGGRYVGAWRTRAGTDGIQHLSLPYVDAAAGNLIAGRNGHGCSVVVRHDTILWRRCGGFKPVVFSPDGRYLAAFHTATGGEFETVVILDAQTGRRVTDSNEGRPSSFHGMPGISLAWEDSRHLLTVFLDRETRDSEVLRLSLDGRLTRATGAIKTDPTDPGFIFVAN